ncbi:carbohydrate-binding protein [Acetivibrio cellulolyticus]|uniref:carbohydrate-binding protein n=1 Tax=Acetivibrio cellulolyticus TaxID=35830 RepID=UPI0001E2F5F3|nr:carbohydrate-binding protein [Acetivibrio cellulolyticus]
MDIYRAFETKSSIPEINTGCKSSGCNECGCESFNVEFADEVIYDNYSKGVSLTTLGDKVILTYNGLLAKSGANQVFATIGFGDNTNWQNVSTSPMNNKNQHMFELSIPAKDSGQINVAFKDSANNWDNNSGKNYSFYIQ